MAIRQPYPARALNLNEEGIGPVLEPDELQSLADKGTFLDLAAREVGLGLAIAPAPIGKSGFFLYLIGKATRSGGFRYMGTT